MNIAVINLNSHPSPFIWDKRDEASESGLQSANEGNEFLHSANDGGDNLETANE